MSYERMEKEEARLREKVKGLLAAAETVDAEEDARYGKGVRGDELPAELQRAESRLARIQEAKKALEREAKAGAEKDKDDDDGPPPPEDLPSHKVPHTPEGKPTAKAQRNFTDPESRIVKTGTASCRGSMHRPRWTPQIRSSLPKHSRTSHRTQSTCQRWWTASPSTSRRCLEQ
jgi:hypothetical protein